MPAPRLPPGVYERLLSLALDKNIRGLDKRFAAQTEAPDDAERPRLLARYVHHLLTLALDAQKGDDSEARQLDLCRRVLDELIGAKDTGLETDDHLREPHPAGHIACPGRAGGTPTSRS